MPINPLPRLYVIQSRVEQILMDVRGIVPEATCADISELAEELRELIADMTSGNNA
jgi:hypothetical protein